LKKKTVILGGGESGAGAAVLAQKKGHDVFVSDFGKIKDKYKDVLSHFEIKFEEGKHSENIILNADEVVKSPGIPDNVDTIKKLKAKGINIISEIEFAARYTTAKKVCITGSNGKTTTTLLTHHILSKAGLNVGVAGNVGQSFAMQVAEKNHDIYVLEISSFQLDGMYEFKADIAVLMNITPDHLDRYDHDFQNYVDSKFRIIQNQTIADSFIYCYDDPVIKKELAKRHINQKTYPFSIFQKIQGQGAYLEKQNININIKPKFFNMTLGNLALQGKHNIYNSMAAGVVGRLLDIRKTLIQESLSDFQNVEHRLEFVARIHGVDFINDSKATNVNSTWYALESMSNQTIWIAGGVDKGNDYKLLKDLVGSKVKAIVCVGNDNKKLMDTFEDVVEFIVEASNMDEAVKYGLNLASQEDTVLLSPACASFDRYENFEERGNQFKKAVAGL